MDASKQPDSHTHELLCAPSHPPPALFSAESVYSLFTFDADSTIANKDGVLPREAADAGGHAGLIAFVVQRFYFFPLYFGLSPVCHTRCAHSPSPSLPLYLTTLPRRGGGND